MKIEFCPRCGTKRPDELQWCRKCGLDFQKAERGELPAAAPEAPRPVSGWVVNSVERPRPGPSQPYQQPSVPVVEVRPTTDRQQMARWSAQAMDVRCGGTAGGCLGGLIGLVLLGYVGIAIGGIAPAFFAPLGLFLGLWLGTRVALGLMAGDR